VPYNILNDGRSFIIGLGVNFGFLIPGSNRRWMGLLDIFLLAANTAASSKPVTENAMTALAIQVAHAAVSARRHATSLKENQREQSRLHAKT
jgi:hypothetical protein